MEEIGDKDRETLVGQPLRHALIGGTDAPDVGQEKYTGKIRHGIRPIEKGLHARAAQRYFQLVFDHRGASS